MATQIASTPIIKGKEVKEVLSEIKQSSKEAENGAKKLANIFNKMI